MVSSCAHESREAGRASMMHHKRVEYVGPLRMSSWVEPETYIGRPRREASMLSCSMHA